MDKGLEQHIEESGKQHEQTAEEGIMNVLNEIVSDLRENEKEVTLITGRLGKEGFHLHEMAQLVANYGFPPPVKKMSRKRKKARFGTISYRKKYHPDFGVPLSKENLTNIVQNGSINTS